MRIKALAFAVAVSIAVPMTASANIQQQVNTMFGQLMNVTGPGSYKTASRGVISGGSIALRNRITTANIISITPPTAKGGCGGINLYTGSFSFINGEEFVGLMRNIASNAVGVVSGYAFEAALSYMDEATAGIIRGLRNNIQRLNEMFSNSCQLASGIVNGGMKALEENKDLKSAATSMLENVTTDFFSSKTATASSPDKRLSDAGKMKPCFNSGNVMWCGLQKVGLISPVGGEKEYAELIMSIVGSRIVSEESTSDGSVKLTSKPLAPILNDRSLSIFVEGTSSVATEAKIWRCDDADKCINPTVTALTSFKGLKQRISEDVRTTQLFEKFARGIATEAEATKAHYFMSSNVGHHLMKIIQKGGADEGYKYFEEFSHVIALNAAYASIMELLDTAHAGLSTVEFAEAEIMKEDLRAARLRVNGEFNKEMQNGTNFRDADRRAAEILASITTVDSGKNMQGRKIEGAGN